MFNWKTPDVCPYTPITECGVDLPDTNEGTRYVDLSPLSMLGSFSGELATKEGNILFNVCSRVIHEGCDPTAGICLIPRNGVDGVSLGQFQSNAPYILDGKVTIDYPSGGPCHSFSDMTATSRIIFICGPEQSSPTLASLTTDGQHCLYVFHWVTCLVCPGVCPSTTTPSTAFTTTASSVVTHPGGSVKTTAAPISAAHAGGTSSAVVAIVVVVSLVAVIAGSVLGYYLYNPERRERLLAFLRLGGSRPKFHYTKVSAEGGSSTSLFGTGDDTDEDDDELMPM